MKKTGYLTPILLLVFNRPDLVVKQLSILRKIQPRYVYIACDGPRRTSKIDSQAIEEIKDSLKQVDWPCEVRTLFREDNLGCKLAVSQAISWFFEQVEAGIILEDDCLANDSFFIFSEELLKKYASDKKVMHISGSNLVSPDLISSSYDFSIHPLSWGWATWRRAWKTYDLEMKDWPGKKGGGFLKKIFTDQRSIKYWQAIFESMYQKKIDTWDYQWIYTIWKAGGLAAIPKYNLVTNVGFDQRATHTKLPFSPLAEAATNSLDFPLQDPQVVSDNPKLSSAIQRFFDKPLLLKLVSGFVRYLSRQTLAT